MERFQLFDRLLDLGTVTVAAFLTFIGFIGVTKIAAALNLVYPIADHLVELVFNFVVFLVLLFSIFNIAFRFKELVSQHWRSINLLTDFITDIDHILAIQSLPNLRSRDMCCSSTADTNTSLMFFRHRPIAIT